METELSGECIKTLRTICYDLELNEAGFKAQLIQGELLLLCCFYTFGYLLG
jgi:hypothetical protein